MGGVEDQPRVEVAVVGTINLDTTIRVPRLPARGETVLGGDVAAVPGGKATNQAVAAARQGAPTALIGCVGDDAAGDELFEFLAAEPRLDVTGVTRLPDVATGRALITVDDAGGNTIASGPGANAHLDDTLVHRWGHAVGEASVLLVQLGVPSEAVRAALEIARGVGTIAILDPAPADDLADDLYRLVDILTPNESEAERLTGIAVRTNDDACRAALLLLARGVTAVVVTMAERGAWYASATNPDGRAVAPHPVDRVDFLDPTASGDAFNGALAAALARGEPIEAALDAASLAGSLATRTRGAAPSMPRRGR
jgi:ribokinase